MDDGFVAFGNLFEEEEDEFESGEPAYAGLRPMTAVSCEAVPRCRRFSPGRTWKFHQRHEDRQDLWGLTTSMSSIRESTLFHVLPQRGDLLPEFAAASDVHDS